jgi:adenylate kinase family enzyme
MRERRHLMLFILGGPGCGKGTMCESLIPLLGSTHICPGELLRASRDPKVMAILAEGGIVPGETTLSLLAQELAGPLSLNKPVLIDGFPRAIDQAELFERVYGPPAAVVLVQCEEETMRRRLLARGRSGTRKDDTEVIANKRIRGYREHTVPVLDHYKKRGLLLVVDAEGPRESVVDSFLKVTSHLF